jgi:very-short-patch-repair endonuclease
MSASNYHDKLFKGASAKIFRNANELRRSSTKAEDLLWQQLRNRKLGGFKFRRQHPINNYIADFYCSEKQVVVEVDGGIHNEKGQKEYDEGRTVDLKSMGIKLIRFTNDEVENEMNIVLKKIIDFINNPK